MKQLKQYPPVSDRPHLKRSRRCALVDVERFTGATYETLDALRAGRRRLPRGSHAFRDLGLAAAPSAPCLSGIGAGLAPLLAQRPAGASSVWLAMPQPFGLTEEAYPAAGSTLAGKAFYSSSRAGSTGQVKRLNLALRFEHQRHPAQA